MTTYTDADHGGNPDNGRSIGGYAVIIGGGAVSISNLLFHCQPLKRSILLQKLGKKLSGCEIFSLNLGSISPLHHSAVTVAKNPEHHGRMKHLDL